MKIAEDGEDREQRTMDSLLHTTNGNTTTASPMATSISSHALNVSVSRVPVSLAKFFREKWLKSFVEMLESHHALVVKALQKLYKFCINKEGFPGEPLAEAPDGHPLTHTILDRLGLIKQAEEKADEADEDSEDLRYLRILSSTECSATAEPSPEPTTPQEPSPTTSSRASVCQTVLAPMASRGRSTWQWDMQSVPQTSFSYPGSGFQDFYPSSRPSVGSADLNPGDISPNLDLSSISMISQESQRQDLRSLAYFLDPLCNIESTSSTTGIKHAGRLNHGLEMSETSAQPTGDLSGDLLSDFTFSTHEHALYQGFNSGWTFSSV
ncbi:hypothetical protein POX_c03973 [Penicillium oxalicum]|uniref:hypothetical protein n=1 Tax=Penicillium oxalicum TaxID=69781 RepID=UPI0020B7277F|nr:hypothetical protein POX_c03973 [Penicillium oxalicum]KAI2791118.1 hypothetical protein POX_c03973 [Penicillium oxalicum]